jgi:hypothetical protein
MPVPQNDLLITVEASDVLKDLLNGVCLQALIHIDSDYEEASARLVSRFVAGWAVLVGNNVALCSPLLSLRSVA